jgi:hypothetical protein
MRDAGAATMTGEVSEDGARRKIGVVRGERTAEGARPVHEQRRCTATTAHEQ